MSVRSSSVLAVSSNVGLSSAISSVAGSEVSALISAVFIILSSSSNERAIVSSPSSAAKNPLSSSDFSSSGFISSDKVFSAFKVEVLNSS